VPGEFRVCIGDFIVPDNPPPAGDLIGDLISGDFRLFTPGEKASGSI